jgi:hypothetical protein
MLQNVYQQSENCLVEDMDGELLIYNPDAATTLHLNGPSMVVWSCCNGDASVQEIIDALQDTFPDQAEQISADVLAVFKEFEDNGIVVKTKALS